VFIDIIQVCLVFPQLSLTLDQSDMLLWRPWQERMAG